MAKRVTINDKRLTKQQVKELLSEGAVYDKQVSNAINRQMGHKVLDIYRLPDGNYLYVWRSIETGKGDIWPKEYVEKEIDKQKRERKRPHLKGMSSVDHWYYFSKTKETFPEQIHSLISALFQRLGLSEKNIDYTYDSLDLLAERLDTTKEDVVEAEFYDGIVAYLGEILIRKINGKWDFACGADARIAVRPLIVTKHPWVQYDPITPIFIALRGVQGFRLRQNLVDEIRRHELDRNAFLKEQ
jgi:peptidoglycan/xylan/chitin deacetylase (PgdA/CDA1 family)